MKSFRICMRFDLNDISYGMEIQLYQDNLREHCNDKLLSGLVKVLIDDDEFSYTSLIIDKLDCLPYIRVSIHYDNADISVKYDLEYKKFDISVNLRCRTNSYIYEIQDEICEYVLRLADDLDNSSSFDEDLVREQVNEHMGV